MHRQSAARYARARFGPGGPRHGGGRWRNRVFAQGDLRLIILKLISEKPRHGYEIIKAIEEALGGAYSPSPGVVYPTLQMLEELGQATLASEESGKKLYAATEAGRAHLADEAEAVEAAFARASGGADRKAMLRIRRAMENLRMAVRLRASEPLDEATLSKITAAIDAAAHDVERA